MMHLLADGHLPRSRFSLCVGVHRLCHAEIIIVHDNSPLARDIFIPDATDILRERKNKHGGEEESWRGGHFSSTDALCLDVRCLPYRLLGVECAAFFFTTASHCSSYDRILGYVPQNQIHIFSI